MALNLCPYMPSMLFNVFCTRMARENVQDHFLIGSDDKTWPETSSSLLELMRGILVPSVNDLPCCQWIPVMVNGRRTVRSRIVQNIFKNSCALKYGRLGRHQDGYWHHEIVLYMVIAHFLRV